MRLSGRVDGVDAVVGEHAECVAGGAVDLRQSNGVLLLGGGDAIDAKEVGAKTLLGKTEGEILLHQDGEIGEGSSREEQTFAAWRPRNLSPLGPAVPMLTILRSRGAWPRPMAWATATMSGALAIKPPSRNTDCPILCSGKRPGAAEVARAISSREML